MTKITNDLFLKAARKEQVDRIPVWYMRQAGDLNQNIAN